MFKRVEKRQRKKEEEEALGLDEDMKEIMGLNDTDSDESSSDEDTVDDEQDSPDITIQEALTDPAYSIEPTIKGCIVCPGKWLKSDQMVQIHMASNAHQRRFKQFTALVTDKDPQSDAFAYVPQSKMVERNTTEVSKREEKRRVWKEKMKQKRAKKKMAKEVVEPPRKKPKA